MHRPNTTATGFTLIEILLVTVMIGILAAVLVPTLTGVRKRPHNVAALQCGRALVTAQVTYHARTGEYASRVAQLAQPDVTRTCRDVQVTYAGDPAAALPATGSQTITATTDGFGLDLWNPRGDVIYRYVTWADPQVPARTFTPVRP
ncbi:type IV pilin protein [Deinococcus sedimenti]|uniref:Prepilin-type N-terminal cleavage/methylation domain-containing protein n=1 Tax=Deinococcus sedimenti TaxID=1867090 RepID=A0ABQ2S8T2_9DEIO|nr:prepilin-type N-terminal cleavage/methylation domain-containing protein [Deinococcus sedimenti]GGS08695.1 hypothetical protein GCM10008960_38820 [Deinococcus sedimenti]